MGEHGLADQEQLQKPEFCGCLGFILHFSVNNTTAFSYLQSSLGLVGTTSNAFSFGPHMNSMKQVYPSLVQKVNTEQDLSLGTLLQPPLPHVGSWGWG